MSYLQRILSTLTSMNYYSSGSDLLDDHSSPTYLKFVSQQLCHREKGFKEKGESSETGHSLDELIIAEDVCAKMNISYPSTKERI